MPAGLGYVMLSRSENLEDVYIAGTFKPEKIKCVPSALEESERLEQISLTNITDDPYPEHQWFKLSFVNIRSLSKNLSNLVADDVMMKNEVVFVTETWVNPEIPKHYNVEGYENAFANMKGRGKGVGVYFSRDAQIEVCEKELYQFIKLRNEECTIFCLYASKGCDFQEIVKSLDLFGFNSMNEFTLLIGDFNYDFGKKKLSC